MLTLSIQTDLLPPMIVSKVLGGWDVTFGIGQRECLGELVAKLEHLKSRMVLKSL